MWMGIPAVLIPDASACTHVCYKQLCEDATRLCINMHAMLANGNVVSTIQVIQNKPAILKFHY